MKGIILKDIYQVKLLFVLVQILSIFFYVMGFFIVLGMTHSEVVSPSEEELLKISAIVLVGMMDYVCISIGSTILIDTSKLDIRSGWAKYERTTPLSGSQLVGGKIAATGIVIGFLVLQALIFGVISIFMGVNPEAVIAMPLVMGMIQLIALSPVFPIVSKFGGGFANFIYIVFEIIVAGAAVVVVFGHFSGDIDGLMLRIIAYAVIPIITALVVFASYKSGMKAIKSDI